MSNLLKQLLAKLMPSKGGSEAVTSSVIENAPESKEEVIEPGRNETPEEEKPESIVKVNIVGDCIETKIKKGSVFSIGGEKYVIKRMIYKYRFFGKEELHEGGDKLLWPYDSNENFIQEEINLIRGEGSCLMYQYRLKTGVYVIYCDHLYPCFDWCDHVYENRYYRSYYICSSFEEAQTKLSYLVTALYDFRFECNPGEKHRVHLAPYVHFDDGAYDDTFTVYEKKVICTDWKISF
jgi:hypothetical protein